MNESANMYGDNWHVCAICGVWYQKDTIHQCVIPTVTLRTEGIPSADEIWKAKMLSTLESIEHMLSGIEDLLTEIRQQTR